MKKTINPFNPTIFHITHVKSGSQWVMQVLKECAPERLIDPKVGVGHLKSGPLVPGAIYPTLYIPKHRLDLVLVSYIFILRLRLYKEGPGTRALLKNWYNFHIKKEPRRQFVVIRDIRDALVSLYFSLKVSHPVLAASNVGDGRKALNELNFEDGFLYLISQRGSAISDIQRTWLPVWQKGDALLIRYEELVADELVTFSKILGYCQMEINPMHVRNVVERNSFEKMTGRHKGEEDVTAHHRKGIVGDWRNYFTDKIKEEVKLRYGQLLIDTGYEKDMNW
ncbi:MAG: sulfotransferase domain-containing protein [Chloroflexi bacterium]|nr:sulfotransferase domain-containing protein [Chloroflexota bacterium]